MILYMFSTNNDSSLKLNVLYSEVSKTKEKITPKKEKEKRIEDKVMKRYSKYSNRQHQSDKY